MSRPAPVRFAVFPVAGRGTRFLPATKASPKEMLPVVDKPLIQYAVDEALAAGARMLVFITGASKRAIEDHFDTDPELEAAFPHKRQARVAIRARGRREEFLQPTRIGDPEAPLSDRALEEKYFELVTPVIGEAKAREVLERLWRLE